VRQIHAASEELGYFPTVKQPSDLNRLDYVKLAEFKAADYRKSHNDRKRHEVPGSNDGERPFRLSDTEIAAGHVTIEKSPQYTTFKTVNRTVAVMHKMLPAAQLIIILRDPVKRAYSGFRQNCLKGRIPDFTLPEKSRVYKRATTSLMTTNPRNLDTLCNSSHFDAMVNVLLSRMQIGANQPWLHDSAPCNGVGCSVLLAGLYATILDQYSGPKRFTRGQLLVVLSENLVLNTVKTMQDILLHIFKGDQEIAKMAEPATWSKAYKNRGGFTVLPAENSKSNDAHSAYDPMLPATEAKLQAFYAASNANLRQNYPEINWPADSYLFT
jgi:hypothetical protein